jgi:hypothetical protein
VWRVLSVERRAYASDKLVAEPEAEGDICIDIALEGF